MRTRGPGGGAIAAGVAWWLAQRSPISRAESIALLDSALHGETGRRLRQWTADQPESPDAHPLLRDLEPPEIPIAVLYLSGEVPQGRCGIGQTALRAAAARQVPS